MTQKKLLSLTALVAIALTSCLSFKSFMQSDSKYGFMMIQNVEALSDDENGGKVYARCEGNCCICAKDDENSIVIHGHAKFL